VVGAGPAGLATAAMLARAGASVRVFDRSAIAGAWLTRYDRLHLHTVRWLSSLPGYRFPRSAGKWPSRDAVVEYLRRYAERFELDVREGVEIWRIDRSASGWTLLTDDGAVEAGRVVVATGNSSVPFVPHWQGTFGGPILHSADYRNPGPYANRRVLVVGAGNSAAEIATDLADGGAAEVLLAVRTPPHIVRRDTLGFPSQVMGIAAAHLPVGLADAIAATVRRVSLPDLAAQGLPAQPAPYSYFLRRRAIPILDVGIVDAVRDGRVRVVGPMDRFEPGAAVLADGAQVEVDAVIAATGFRPGLEPLVGHLGVLDTRGSPTVHGADEHPGAPGLHFVGYRVSLGGAFRLAAIEARRVGEAASRCW
jgi:putative flavoprotein involved in K+ transport